MSAPTYHIAKKRSGKKNTCRHRIFDRILHRLRGIFQSGEPIWNVSTIQYKKIAT
jgi:hypothetical protein